MNKEKEVYELAKSICSCSELKSANEFQSHPCFKVAAGQNILIDGDEGNRQRPEPWIGNLGGDRVIFISSNPSISDGPMQEREDFPTFQLDAGKSADFFVNRFNQKNIPIHATFNHPVEPSFLTRSVDGEYRSGIRDSQKTPVKTWKSLHQRAIEILGPDCDPNVDYALTEIVHCKSKGELGVKDASSHCADKWMEKILHLSSANVVILVGSKVRDAFALPFLKFPSDFGANQREYFSLGKKKRALRDIQVSNFGGRPRLYLFNWHPTGMIKKDMLVFETVYGPELLNWIIQIANSELDVPSDKHEVNLIIEKLCK